MQENMDVTPIEKHEQSSINAPAPEPSHMLSLKDKAKANEHRVWPVMLGTSQTEPAVTLPQGDSKKKPLSEQKQRQLFRQSTNTGRSGVSPSVSSRGYGTVSARDKSTTWAIAVNEGVQDDEDLAVDLEQIQESLARVRAISEALQETHDVHDCHEITGETSERIPEAHEGSARSSNPMVIFMPTAEEAASFADDFQVVLRHHPHRGAVSHGTAELPPHVDETRGGSAYRGEDAYGYLRGRHRRPVQPGFNDTGTEMPVHSQDVRRPRQVGFADRRHARNQKYKPNAQKKRKQQGKR